MVFRQMIKIKKSKKGLEMAELGYWILALIGLVLLVGIILFLSGRLGGMTDFLKNIFGLG